MSFAALNWAQHDVPELSMGEAFTLMCLANYADEDNSCYPSQEQLARDVHTSYASVKRYLKTLRELGLIRVESRSSIYGRKVNRYVLNVGMTLRDSETAGRAATAQIELLHDDEKDAPVDNLVFSQVTQQQLNLSCCGDDTPATAQSELSQQLNLSCCSIYTNHHLETTTPYQASKEGLSAGVDNFSGGVVGVDDVPDSLPVTSSATAPQPHLPIPAPPPSPQLHVSVKEKTASSVAVDRYLLDRLLPSDWLEKLPRNAQARLSRDVGAWVRAGGDVSVLRRRLENDTFPQNIRNFSGLVIHRVSQALEAVPAMSKDEKKSARRGEIRRLAEGVLDGNVPPSPRLEVQLSNMLGEVQYGSDLYSLVEQACRRLADVLHQANV